VRDRRHEITGRRRRTIALARLRRRVGGLGADHAAYRVGAATDVKLTLNGRERIVADVSTVEQLLHSVDLDPRFVIVERNGEPVERKRYPDTLVADGDRLELVRAVAGG